MSIDLKALRLMVDSLEIEEVYSILGYDYASEIEHGAALDSNDPRREFLARMAWVSYPTSVEIRRLFNQINSFFAEKWAMRHVNSPVPDFLSECNRLILYRQGKRLGPRNAEIEFGVRMDLDFLDPRRQFKQLRGITASLINDALDLWNDTVDRYSGAEDLALALVLAVIAIHPFFDGNGRLGRVAYTWLRARWRLTPLWLAEDAEGEFLRTGHGLMSTEHLMSAVMLQICGGHNSVGVGQWDHDSNRRAFDSLKGTLGHLGDSDSLMLTEAFIRLKQHMEENGHFRSASPRFDSLSTLLR